MFLKGIRRPRSQWAKETGEIGITFFLLSHVVECVDDLAQQDGLTGVT